MVKPVQPALSVTMAIVSLLIAAVAAAGLIMKTDPVGRIIFALVWLLVGIAWAMRLIRAG